MILEKTHQMFKIINKKNKKEKTLFVIKSILYDSLKIDLEILSLLELILSFKFSCKMKHDKITVISSKTFFLILISVLVNNTLYRLSCKFSFLKNNKT